MKFWTETRHSDLTEIDVKLACWWGATESPRSKLGKRLKVWAEENRINASMGRWDAVPMPPTRDDNDG